MRINPDALQLLDYLADKDVPAGFCNGSESHARTLSDYIYEYTENLPIHMPADPDDKLLAGGKKGLQTVIDKLNSLRTESK